MRLLLKMQLTKLFNFGIDMFWIPLNLDTEETPEVTYTFKVQRPCDHELVNVSFNHIHYVCRLCDADFGNSRPEEYDNSGDGI